VVQELGEIKGVKPQPEKTMADAMVREVISIFSTQNVVDHV